MHRDICDSNRASILRWLDEYATQLQEFRALLARDDEKQGAELLAYFNRARDARADWATAERTDGQLTQDTEAELSKTALSGQFSQMLFGGLARRRPGDSNKGTSANEPKRREREDRK
jgi:hypothetical protein